MIRIVVIMASSSEQPKEREIVMNEYEKQATEFLASTGATIECTKLGTFPFFSDDEEPRDVFNVTIARGTRSYSFKFGDSLANTMKRAVARTPNLVPTTEMMRHVGVRNSAEFSAWVQRNKEKLRAVPKQPTAYSILAAMTKYNPGSFKSFRDEFGYSTDSTKARDAYIAVQDEYHGLCSLFTNEEMELLAEIN